MLCRWNYFGFGLLRFFEVDYYSFWRSTRSSTVVEDTERFGRSPTLRPVNRVEAEIVALMWIRAGIDEQPDYVRVTVDHSENERSSSAARPLVYVCAIGQ
jgi:hypothetical protein